MKRVLFLLLILFLTIEGVSQRKDRKQSLTYEETQQYISKAAAILNVGDTIFLREADRGLRGGY